MKKPLYKRELSHSYLVMEDIPEEWMNHYQYRMILRNRIPGLLVSSERFLEGRACLYYDISSRQSLEQLYLSSKIGMKEVRGIIDNLAQVLDSMSEYLLEERFLILEPEYIYMDLETEQLFFLYYPFQEEREEETRYLPLAEFFLEHVDHREEKAVSAAYQFYKMSKVKSFMVGSFRTFLERELSGERELTESRGYGRPEPCIQAAAGFFYEEEGPYEYRTVPESELEEVEEEKREKSGPERKKQEKAKKWKDRAGLAATAVIFLLLCALIWYLSPEGGEKILMFAILALDGILLLVFLWRVSAARPDGEEKEEQQEEEAPESSLSFWEEYTPQEHEELEGPTVYLSRDGQSGYDGSASFPGRRPRLTGTPDGGYGKELEYSLERLPVLVGKLKSRSQILLSDASVSRIHARFVEREGRTGLIDLNSTNGTFVNGVRLEQEEVVTLEDGDEIRFGNVQMKYQER